MLDVDNSEVFVGAGLHGKSLYLLFRAVMNPALFSKKYFFLKSDTGTQ